MHGLLVQAAITQSSSFSTLESVRIAWTVVDIF